MHQWYWSYSYPDFLGSNEELIEFDSYIVPTSDLEVGSLRLLEVDNRVILPELTHTRFVITSGDVIHKKVRIGSSLIVFKSQIPGKP